MLGLIEILTATEDSIHNQLGKTTANSTVHSTLVDVLENAGTLAIAEGADFTAAVLRTPTRLSNVVQEVVKQYKVTSVQRAIQHFQPEDELTRQRTKGMKDWLNSVEYDLLRSTLVSGVSSATAAKMSGIIEACSKSTNHTSHSSGTTWSASVLKGLMKANWDNSNGDVATDLYMGSVLKDKTDDFTNKSTNVVSGTNVKEIVMSVDVIESGLGKVRVHPHRYMQVSGTDVTSRVVGIRPEKLKVAYLERPRVMKMPANGAYDVEAVYGSMTLEVRNQDSQFYADGFLLT